jgi:hypothetical protein
MTPIHSDVKHFMSTCERLLGLYFREGKRAGPSDPY